MKKTFIAIAAVIIASASIFWACSKDSENEEVKKTVFNKNAPTLSEFIQSLDTPEEIDFFKKHQIVDNSNICNEIISNSHLLKANTTKPQIKFRWSGSGCKINIGICLFIPFETESNANVVIVDDKCVIIPTTSDNGLTSDGYLPIFEDVAIGEEKMISQGIYKASYNESLNTIAIAVDLK